MLVPVTISRQEKSPSHRPSKEQAKLMAGDYWYKEGDSFLRLQIKGEELQMVFGDGETHGLLEVSPAHFHVADVPWSENMDIHFMPGAEGKPRAIEQRYDGGKPDILEAVPPFEPSASDLMQYRGIYGSSELDPLYRLVVANGSLQLQRPKHALELLKPVTNDVFTAPIGTVRFNRRADQTIKGFTLDAGRVQGITFDKTSPQ